MIAEETINDVKPDINDEKPDINYLIKDLDKNMKDFKEIISENSFDVENVIHNIEKKQTKKISNNLEETQYLDLLNDILLNGIDREDRTGIGTRSIFGGKLNFDLTTKFPLLTTKKMWLKGIFHELMWILSGSTDNKELQKNKVKIWNGNSSREFLDSRNLHHYEEGDIGPTYGFAVRSYGMKYDGCAKNYIGCGFDQLEYIIDLIKNEPTSRRILINLWDPTVIDDVALTPCLMTYNFYVDTVNKKLNLQGYIRSSDTLLGLPWNVSYLSLLVYLICNIKGIDLTPGKLNIVTCDQHIYRNHFDQVSEQLKREPYPFPKLNIKRKVDNISDFTWDDLELIDYKYHESIKAAMAV